MTIVETLIHPEIEEAVLGSILVTGQVGMIEQVKPDHFGILRNRQIMQAIMTLAERDEGLDVVLLGDELKRMGILESVGGMPYILSLLSSPGAAFGSSHVERLQDYARRRTVLQQASRLAQAAHSLEAALEPAIDQAMTALAGMALAGQDGAGHWSADLSALYDDVEYRYSHPQELHGITTGLIDLDRVTGGLQIGESTLIAGPPGIGKSILARQLGVTAVTLGSQPGLAIYSLEMRSLQECRRIVSAMAKIPTRTLKNGRMTADEWMLFCQTVEQAEALPVYIYPRATLTTAQLRADLARLRKVYNVTVFILDYMLLMSDEIGGMSAYERGDYLSRKVLPLSKDLGMVGILVNPVLKDGMDGEIKGLSQVRGSQVLYDADNVVVMGRPGEACTGMTAAERENVRVLAFQKGREMEMSQSTIYLVKHPSYPLFMDAEIKKGDKGNGKFYWWWQK